MLVSRRWLSDYVQLKDLSNREVAEYLNDLGLEVEGISSSFSFDDLIIVGRVLEVSPHQGAENLSLCKIDIAKSSPLSVICGAANVRADIKVAVAQIGTILPGKIKIKRSKIRGVLSEGMLCSSKELAINDEDGGNILELPEHSTIGEKIADFLLESDTIFEISVTPNRGDCLGYLGIARELAAKLEQTLQEPRIRVNYPKIGFQLKTMLSSQIQQTSLCPRLVLFAIDQITHIPTPSWIKQRLNMCGMRSIHLIVDISNFLMLEYGQPIHTYDWDRLPGKDITIQSAYINQKIMTLDGESRVLEEGDIIVTSNHQPVALAGIMGSESSEVCPQTKRVLIEIACFNPENIRKTSKRLKLHTEASYRFERGIDINKFQQISKRFITLVYESYEEHRKFQSKTPFPHFSEDIIDKYPEPVQPKKFFLD